MESELVDKEVEGSAFVYGSLGFVEKVLCGVMLYILESYESKLYLSFSSNVCISWMKFKSLKWNCLHLCRRNTSIVQSSISMFHSNAIFIGIHSGSCCISWSHCYMFYKVQNFTSRALHRTFVDIVISQKLYLVQSQGVNKHFLI